MSVKDILDIIEAFFNAVRAIVNQLTGKGEAAGE